MLSACFRFYAKYTKQEEKVKKSLMILVSIGLIMVFTMPALGADVKFSGTYIVQGYYDNNRALADNGALGTGPLSSREGASISDMWQRLRLQTDFQVAEGLKLTTRADIMERVWGVGHASSSVTNNPYNATGTAQQEAYNQEAENIRFNNVYVTANILGGVLKAGYVTQGAWGTDFGNTGDLVFGPRIRYEYYTGPWTLVAYYDWYEGTKPVPFNGSQLGTSVDSQEESPQVAVVYTWAKGNAGLKVNYLMNHTNSGATPAGSGFPDNGYKANYWQFNPYWKAQFGPVYTEGEVIYRYGKTVAYESDYSLPNNGDVQLNSWSGYATATVDIKPAYVGGTLVYVEGDSPAVSGSPNTTSTVGAPGGVDFNPCLILFNYDSMRWNGGLGWGPYAGNAVGTPINNSSTSASGITNAFIVQVFGGIKPIPKLDIKAAVTWAKADKDAAQRWVDRNYGWEGDLTATYKIYDNLSYMVGFGYLWAGDFWKGTQNAAVVDNDYLLTHKLTLSF
jgi:hypothetical protein